MKKWLQLCMRCMSRHLGMSVFLVIQIICLCIGLNLLLASRNHQTVLIKPFADLLESDGYYLASPDSITTWDGVPFKEALQGEWQYIGFEQYITTRQTAQGEISLKVMVYDNAFWDAYAPVMQHGRWKSSDAVGDVPWCVVTPNIYSHDMLQVYGIQKEIDIKGCLADLCYIPSMHAWQRDGSIADNFYQVFDLDTTDTAYVLMPQSQWDLLNQPDAALHSRGGCIAIPTSELTDEQREINESVFRDCAHPEIELSLLKERAEADLEENTRRFLPLLLTQFLITLFGIVCATAMQTLQERSVTAVYFLCGMQQRQRTILSLGQALCLVAVSSGWVLITYAITKMLGFHANYGLQFRWNNLLISMVLMIAIVISSLFSDYFVNRAAHPMILLRRQQT